MTLHFSLAFEEIAKSPGSRLLNAVYNVLVSILVVGSWVVVRWT